MIWFILRAFLIVCLLAGCGGGNPQNVVSTTTSNSNLAHASLVSKTPIDTASNIDILSTITATFDKSLNPLSINNNSVQLHTASGTNITGTPSYDPATNKILFTPTQALAINTVYTATLTTLIRDSNNNPLASNITWSFTTAGITPSPATLSVTDKTPADTSTNIATNSTITATFNNDLNNTTINSSNLQVRTSGGSTVTGTLSYDINTKKITFTPAQLLTPSTTYTTTLTTGIKDRNSNALPANIAWSFTTAAAATPPTALAITFKTPTNNAVGINISSTITVSFNNPLNVSTVTSSSFQVNAAGNTVTGTTSYDASTQKITFTPTQPLPASLLHTVTLTTDIKDINGNALASNATWKFTTASAPLTVTAKTPADTTIGVNVASVITASFNNPLNISTVTSTNIVIAGGSTATTGTLSYDASTQKITFIPTQPLSGNTIYTVTLKTGLKDTYGNILAKDIVWSFTTGNAPNTALYITTKTPADLSSGVDPATKITATLSRGLNASTITAANVQVTVGDNTLVSGTLSYDDPSQTITFTPTQALISGSLYTVTLTTNIKDTNGNGLASNAVWSFTTSGTPNALYLMNKTPNSAATSVDVISNITATFNSTLDISTLTAANIQIATASGTAIANTISYDAATKKITLTPIKALTANTVYIVTLNTNIKDSNGIPLLNNTVWSFTTAAATPLTITAKTPVENATAVDVASTIIATFNNGLDSTTINASSFQVTTGGTAVAGTLSYDTPNKKITFTPTQALSGVVVYNVTATTALKDTNGTALTANTTWSFTTAPSSTIALTVTAKNPADTTIGVDVNTNVTATFNNALNPSSVTTANVLLTGGSTATTGTVSYDASTQKITFTPTLPLSGNTTYTATLKAALRDVNGNTLLNDITWSFTTGAAPNTALHILTKTPADASTAVDINSTINVIFSQPLNATTVTASNIQITLGDGTIATGTLNYDATTKKITFTPTQALLAGTLYSITLTTGIKDVNGNALAANVSWSFTTAGTATSLFVTTKTPTSASTGIDVTSSITAIFNNALDLSTLTASTVQVTSFSGITVDGTIGYDALTHKMTFTPNQAFTANTVYIVKLTTGIKDSNGVALTSDTTWSFTTAVATPLTIVTKTPADAATAINVSSNITVTFNNGLDTSTINTSNFQVSTGGVAITGSLSYDATTKKITFTPSQALAGVVIYSVALNANIKDTNGSALTATTWSFTTAPSSTVALVVTAKSPADTTIGVDVASAISATFNTSLNPTSVTTANFIVTGGGTITGTLNYDDATKKITFTPSLPLLGSTIYTVTLKTGLKDVNGNTLAADIVWSFSTAPASNASLFISAKTPADTATGIDTATTITATFSRALNATTITATTVQVTAGDGSAVTGTLAYDSAAQKIVFTPTQTLLTGMVYSVTLTTGIKDTLGNGLPANAVWSFTTTGTPSTLYVSAKTPTSLATGVDVISSITATFNSPLNASTVTASTFQVITTSGTVIPGTLNYDAPSHKITFTPTQALTANTVYVVTLTTGITDTGGIHLSSNTIWSFTTAVATPLTITTQTPASGATAVDVTAPITITFNNGLNASTVSTGSVQVTVGGVSVAGTVSYNATTKTITFTATVALTSGTTYTVTLTTTIADTNGSTLATTTWNFTTAGIAPASIDGETLNIAALPINIANNMPTPISLSITPLTPSSNPSSNNEDVRYQAEEQFFSGGVINTGNSIQHFSNLGARVIFAVNTASSGSYSMTLRYANHSGSPQTFNIYVNGILSTTIQLLPTNNTWSDKTETVALKRGVNTISYQHDIDNTSEEIEIDYLSLQNGIALTSNGATLPYQEYEAENGNTNAQVSAFDTTALTPEAESSGRRNVRLDSTGHYIEWTALQAANTLVVRYMMPDIAHGGNNTGTLSLYVNGSKVRSLDLSSRFTWTTQSHPVYDESRFTDLTIPAGALVKLQKDNTDSASYYIIDLIDLENIEAANNQPSNFVSITSFGAAANDEIDDTQAILDTIAFAKTNNKGVWIPQGTFKISRQISVDNIHIQGAGMWYSTLQGSNGKGGFLGTGQHITLTDLSIVSDTSSANPTTDQAAIEGNFGTGSLIQNIWVEHMKASVWLASGTNGLYMINGRIRNTWTGGVNLPSGTHNTTIRQFSLRNTGDESTAIWSNNADNTNNSFQHNTSQCSVLANSRLVDSGQNNLIFDKID